jgi:hypothetical protein
MAKVGARLIAPPQLSSAALEALLEHAATIFTVTFPYAMKRE